MFRHIYNVQVIVFSLILIIMYVRKFRRGFHWIFDKAIEKSPRPSLCRKIFFICACLNVNVLRDVASRSRDLCWFCSACSMVILIWRIAIAVICLFCSVGTMVVLGIAITVMMSGVVLFTVAVVTYFKAKRNKESKSIHGLKAHSFLLIKCFCLTF